MRMFCLPYSHLSNQVDTVLVLSCGTGTLVVVVTYLALEPLMQCIGFGNLHGLANVLVAMRSRLRYLFQRFGQVQSLGSLTHGHVLQQLLQQHFVPWNPLHRLDHQTLQRFAQHFVAELRETSPTLLLDLRAQLNAWWQTMVRYNSNIYR